MPAFFAEALGHVALQFKVDRERNGIDLSAVLAGDLAQKHVSGGVFLVAEEGPELADAKAYLTGSYALRFGSSSSIARQLLFLQLEDLGIDYIDKRNDLINAVTLEDVRRAAQRIFGNGTPTVAIVGSADG